MAIDPIGQAQPYGCPLYENVAVKNAQVVFILEDPKDPNQPERSAWAALNLGTKKGDVVLVQAPRMSGYDARVITCFYRVTRQFYGLFNFDHDPTFGPWDFAEPYLKRKEAFREKEDLFYLVRKLGTSPLSQADEELYRTVLKPVFAGGQDPVTEEEQVISALKSGIPAEITQAKNRVEIEIDQRYKRILGNIGDYTDQRQDSLMSTISEHLSRRKIYVLCEVSRVVDPESKRPIADQTERLINFLGENKLAFAIIDASSDACIIPSAGPTHLA